MPPRIAIVGTDTEIGKTHLVEALLYAATATGRRVLPFKPAQSGPDRPTDADRLARACDLNLTASAICPLVYEPPLAPGIAHDRAQFLRTDPHVDPEPLETALRHLAQLESRHHPDLVIIEGAGGLHVPMPGGNWLDHWLGRMTDRAVVVGRAGLGTINHTLLTVEALRTRGIEVVGFVHMHRPAQAQLHDPSRPDNAAVIAARGVRHLGTLPPGEPDAPALQAVARPILAQLVDG